MRVRLLKSQPNSRVTTRQNFMFRGCPMFLCIFLLAFSSPCNGNPKELTHSCLQNLAEVAYAQTESRHRGDYQDFLVWKNTPNSKPATIDLSEWDKRNSQTLAKFLVYLPDQNPSRYEEAVFHLKQGDTVVFDGRKFTLGAFLGSGNATHIFELAGNPSTVIRIPFLSGCNNLIGKTKHGHPFNYAKLRMKQFVEKMPLNQQAVRIIEADPKNRYAVVSRVNGTENALSFLNSLSSAPQNISRNIPDTSTIQDWINSSEGERVHLLIHAMEINHDSWSAARQYIWDVALNQWIKIDDA